MIPPRSKFRVACVAALVSVSAATTCAIEFSPLSPAPAYSLVRIAYGTGDSVAVLRIVDGMPINVDVLDCGADLAFTGPPAAYLIGAIESGKLKFYGYRIGDAPGPGPDPPDPPTPEPLPPGQYGLAQWTYDRVSVLPAPMRKNAKALAASYRQGATDLTRLMRAGAVSRTVCVGGVCRIETYVPGTTCDHIMETVAASILKRNTAIVSSSEWRVKFGRPLNDRLNELRRTDESLRLVAGFAVAMKEIALGFEAAVK